MSRNMATISTSAYYFANDAMSQKPDLERFGQPPADVTGVRNRCGARIILGLMAADRAHSWRGQNSFQMISLYAYAKHGFWLGLLRILIFYDGLGLVTTRGFRHGRRPVTRAWAEVWDRHGFRHS